MDQGQTRTDLLRTVSVNDCTNQREILDCAWLPRRNAWPCRSRGSGSSTHVLDDFLRDTLTPSERAAKPLPAAFRTCRARCRP